VKDQRRATMSVDYLLHENPIGYAIFKVIAQPDTIGSRLKEVQNAVEDLAKFGKTVELVGLSPFQGAHSQSIPFSQFYTWLTSPAC
jgi:nucleolar protein 56